MIGVDLYISSYYNPSINNGAKHMFIGTALLIALVIFTVTALVEALA